MVDVSASTVPSAEQTLIATGPATATWQTLIIPGSTSGTAGTTDATPITMETLPTNTNTNTMYHIVSRIVGRRTDVAGQGGGYTLTADYINNAGTVSRVGLVDDIVSNETVPNLTWNVRTVTSGTNILLQVTGALSQTVTWRSSTSTVSV